MSIDTIDNIDVTQVGANLWDVSLRGLQMTSVEAPDEERAMLLAVLHATEILEGPDALIDNNELQLTCELMELATWMAVGAAVGRLTVESAKWYGVPEIWAYFFAGCMAVVVAEKVGTFARHWWIRRNVYEG